MPTVDDMVAPGVELYTKALNTTGSGMPNPEFLGIEPGKVVTLKSGGPAMVVSHKDDNSLAVCVWIDDNGMQRELHVSPLVLKEVSLQTTLTPILEPSTTAPSTGEHLGGKMVDSSVLRKSLNSPRWKQQLPSPGLLDQWILEADSSAVEGPVTLVIAKKQAEGQWRVSYNMGVFPKQLSHNAGSLNQALRTSLSALSEYGIPDLPWTDGSSYEPAIAAAQAAINAEAAVPSAEIDPQVEKPVAKGRVSARARTQAAAAAPPTQPMVEEKEQVKMSGGYKSHFKYGKEHKMSGIDLIVEAAAHGAKVGVADEAGNATLGIAEAIFGEHYPEMAKTERGRTIMKGVAAGLTLMAADKYPELFGSLAEGAKNGCTMVIEAAGRDLIQPELKKITPLVKQLAEVGAGQLKSIV
jgi:uncharacterized protein YodC (DUF2158 family)